MDCGTVNTPQNRHIVTPNISPPCDWTGKPRKGKLVEVVACFGGGQGRKWWWGWWLVCHRSAEMLVSKVKLRMIMWFGVKRGGKVRAATRTCKWSRSCSLARALSDLSSHMRAAWPCTRGPARTHKGGRQTKEKKSRKNDSAPWTALAWIVGLLVGGRRGKVRGSMGDVSPSKHRLCTLSSWPW